MPRISVDMVINAPAAKVWSVVTDIERYPDSMTNVRWVRILEPGVERRSSKWSITLKGSILEWSEIEELDHADMIMAFTQTTGDMEQFEGAWRLSSVTPESTRAELTIDFEIGIPLLAQMLNPVAQRSLRINCTEMLEGIERDATAALA